MAQLLQLLLQQTVPQLRAAPFIVLILLYHNSWSPNTTHIHRHGAAAPQPGTLQLLFPLSGLCFPSPLVFSPTSHGAVPAPAGPPPQTPAVNTPSLRSWICEHSGVNLPMKIKSMTCPSLFLKIQKKKKKSHNFSSPQFSRVVNVHSSC